MTGSPEWVTQLQQLDRSEWPRFLGEHSGLPGPRANLSLVEAAMSVCDDETVALLEKDGSEFAMMCAAATLASRADQPIILERVRAAAVDARWRVREGVAIGLQRLGDRDLPSMLTIVGRWTDDPSPLVQRAAIAAICEPRLLRTPEAARTAIEACATTTASLTALPDHLRRAPDARTLRQALGYCWSVAIAADPDSGLPAFLALDTAHPDVAWIVTQNRRKKRLAPLLG